MGISRVNLAYTDITTLLDTDSRKESNSRPDFLLYLVRDDNVPRWEDVELVLEHTESQDTAAKVTEKFSRWLRNAFTTFHHQPFRRHLYVDSCL